MVTEWKLEKYCLGHMRADFKPAGVGPDRIPKAKIRIKDADQKRAPYTLDISATELLIIYKDVGTKRVASASSSSSELARIL